MIVYDQPGHEDEAGRDSKHYSETNKMLEEQSKVTAYIMILDGKVPDSKECLARLRMNKRIYFDYFDKVIFVVSKWAYDPISIIRREEKNISEDQFEKELYEMIEYEFNYKGKPKVFYIDSAVDFDDNFSKEKFHQEKNGFIQEVNRMREQGDTQIFINKEDSYIYQ